MNVFGVDGRVWVLRRSNAGGAPRTTRSLSECHIIIIMMSVTQLFVRISFVTLYAYVLPPFLMCAYWGFYFIFLFLSLENLLLDLTMAQRSWLFIKNMVEYFFYVLVM